MADASTPGGRLRALRGERGLSMEAVALAAGLSYRTVHKLETGSTAAPAHATVQQVLAALDGCLPLDPAARAAVLRGYGLQDTVLAPTPSSDAWARHRWHQEFDELPHPAHLVDLRQRLLDWNPTATRLLDTAEDPGWPASLLGRTVVDLLTEPSLGLAGRLRRNGAFVRSFAEQLRWQLAPFRDERWCQGVLRDLVERVPGFAAAWASTATVPTLRSRALGPFHLRVDGEDLTFKHLGTALSDDPRYFVVQWIPADLTTMERCVAWARAASRANRPEGASTRPATT